MFTALGGTIGVGNTIGVAGAIKEGYIFIEWQLDGETFDFDTEIKEDYNPSIIIIGNSEEGLAPDYNISIKCENEIQQLFANVVILQQIALEIALNLKRNVDNPKGLHKVVVEKAL